MVIYIEDTDENADWIKWRTDDIRVSEEAKKLLLEISNKGELNHAISK